jgi:hypothetical protein
MKFIPIAAFLLIGLTIGAQPPRLITLSQARFATGDDTAWARANFNDTLWYELHAPGHWELQGHDLYNGFAWYRFHFQLPSSLRDNAWLKDSLRFRLAKIDDADEVFLNGTAIAKHGSFPQDPGGYVTRYNDIRDIHLSTTDTLLRWDQENVLAIRVYDGGGPGGIYGGDLFLAMMGLQDGLQIGCESGSLRITNALQKTIAGLLSVTVHSETDDAVNQEFTKSVELSPGSSLHYPLSLPVQERTEVRSIFTEKNSGETVLRTEVPPYILTPRPAATPRINSASIFGVRPGSPFLFKIAATGTKPLRYAVEGLPAGLRLDTETGLITGTLEREGDYDLRITVSNPLGKNTAPFRVRCGNVLALTPPMGWNSWNCWGLSVSDEKLRASAQALIDKGLADHGWTYMNIDDGWEAPQRAADGTIRTNEKFPDMKALGDWLHARGLKFGIYSSPGPTTCGGYLGSWQHERRDADTYNQWGIDYLKYDWCSYESIHGSTDTTLASYILPYSQMQQYLRTQPRDMVYSLCQYGMKDVWKWGESVDGNCWRTTGDIVDTWESLRSIGFRQHAMSPYAKPGRWNDPDMLIVGQVGWGENLHPTRLTPDEQYTHISLWCLLAAPLLIGCDIARMDEFTLNLLTNDEVIALNQDPLGQQARRIIHNTGYEVWMKALADGSHAVGIFNLSETTKEVLLPWNELGLEGDRSIRDCWRQKEMGRGRSVSTRIPPHGVTLLRIRR